jgi:hypothetical protein
MARNNLFPTPRASDGEGGATLAENDGGGWYRKNKKGERFGVKLRDVVYTTPTAQDAKNSTFPASQAKRSSLVGDLMREMTPPPTPPQMEEHLERGEKVGGQLNPDWVEWVMGTPIGWTSLKPLPAKRFDTWLKKMKAGTWWLKEPKVARIRDGVVNRVQRLQCLGNGQVPLCAAVAWWRLSDV